MSTSNGRRRPPLQIRASKEFTALLDTARRCDARGDESDESRVPAARALMLIGAASLGRDMRYLRAEILKALSAPLAPDVEEALHALLEGAELPTPRPAARAGAGVSPADGLAGHLDEPGEPSEPDEPEGLDPFEVGQEY